MTETTDDNTAAGITAIERDVLDRLLELGVSASPMRDHPGGGKVLVLPNGFHTEHMVDGDLKPNVTRRSPTFHETQSFIDYVNTFKIPKQTRIFFDPEKLRALAIIDYDAPDSAERAAHRAFLQLAESPEWKIWRDVAAGTVRQGLSQEQFAEFLEEHGINVETPPAAALMELALKMQVTRQVNYKKVVNLQDGRTQFMYTNEDGNASSSEFPPKLVVGIPVFKGGQPYKVTVLLRYRLSDTGTLRFAMIIHRAGEIQKHAIDGDMAAIAAATEVPVHIGTV